MSNEINRWEFEKELLRIPSKIKKLSNETSKKHMTILYNKYECLLNYNQREKKRNEDYRMAFNSLKSGKIKFTKGGKDCHINISHIIGVELTEEKIIVSLSNGSNENFCIDGFSYLLTLLG